VSLELTQEELGLFGDISRLAAALWADSLRVQGLNTDPKMFSIMLFKRLWSNHRGFTLLWNNRLTVEADIVLRSGVEAAICIAANYRLRDEFVQLVRQDAAATLRGQIKLHREEGEMRMANNGEEVLRIILRTLPAGTKAQRLSWQMLAEAGGVPQLYSFHRMLSGVSSHVTGLSLLRGVTGEGLERYEEELRAHTQKMHPMMMAGATLQGSMLHAGVIGADDKVEVAHSLVQRLNVASTSWPGAEQ
jgi:hypothetical protein